VAATASSLRPVASLAHPPAQVRNHVDHRRSSTDGYVTNRDCSTCATMRFDAFPAQRGEIGGTSLGLMAYLDLKGEGDSSMPANQRSCPGVWGDALGDPRDTAKARLPESQSPEGAKSHPPERRLEPAPPVAAGWVLTGRTPHRRSDVQRGR
jgi:hypothetical protein